MKPIRRPSRDTIDLLIVQVLTTGLTLPVLSMYEFRLLPPGVRLRLDVLVSPGAALGIPPLEGVVEAATRQQSGLAVLAGTALGLALVTLVVGCATAATLVHRSSLARRSELGVRAAVGATRGDLRDEVISPLAKRLAVGALAGALLGLGLLFVVRTVVPTALVLPSFPLSALAALAVFAPAWAAWAGARRDLRMVLKSFSTPLKIQSATRLAPLGLGGAYFGLLIALLATVAALANSNSYADIAPTEWAEARDTLLFEVQTEDAVETQAVYDAVRSTDRRRAWHLVSAGALEGLGPSAVELSECECPMGLIISPHTRLHAQRHSVSPGVFADLGIPIVAGREFTDADGPDSEGVVVIDSGHLNRYAGVDPIGKQLRVSGVGLDEVWYRIIGVVDVPEPLDLATAHQTIPGVYFSSLQHPPSHGQLVYRDDRGLGSETIELAETAIVTAGVSAHPQGSLAERLAMWAEPLVWFGLLAGIVSVAAFIVGVYGVTALTSLNVRSRTAEFGVRRAVGARDGHVRRLVTREVLEIAGVGAAMGAILGVGLGVGLADRFRAVDPLEPWMLVVVAGSLAIAALLAARSPVKHAVQVTPIEAIGHAE